MRVPSILLLGVLALIPHPSAAQSDRSVDSLVFSIHVDLLAQYDIEDLRLDLEDARTAFQGSQGPGDVTCCTQIDAIDLVPFGTPGDGLDVIDSEAKHDQVHSMNAFVLDITWPNPMCGFGHSLSPGMVIALDCSRTGNIIAHERGHNAVLSHRTDATCQPLMDTNTIAGCLTLSECTSFRALGTTDGVCTCLNPSPGGPPLPDGTACSLDGEAGVCRAGGVCIEGAVSLFPHQKISDTEGGFTGILDDQDNFGGSVEQLGDLDGDGVADLAVGAWVDDDGGDGRGAVWILFLYADGSVKSHQKISDTQGAFTGKLEDQDRFGIKSTLLGDFDGDGVVDLAVGAYRDDDGGLNRGAVWILFLNADGTVKSHQKISDTAGRFAGTLDDEDRLGVGVASLGDLDGDGVGELAVGAYLDDDGGLDRGAVWILFLYADGSVKSHQKISDTQGGFTGTLEDNDQFGVGVASLGDLDGDGVTDLAVSAWLDDDGGPDRGAAWILFLYADGTVKSHQKISNTEGGFTGVLDDYDYFGLDVATLGDVDADGVGDLGVGAYLDDDGGNRRGALWILHLNPNGTVKSHQKISHTQGGFIGALDDEDGFGLRFSSWGSLTGSGVGDLAVGAFLDDDGGLNRGAVWILFIPEPDPMLQYLFAFGCLIVLHRMCRLRVR